MYRAILCEFHVLFMIGKIELLTSDKRQTVTELINNLFVGNEFIQIFFFNVLNGIISLLQALTAFLIISL